MENIVYLMDCMEFLKTCPDKAFDLAIVDPPYGDGNQDVGGGVRFGQRFERYSRPQAQQLPQTGNKEEAEATGGTAGFSDGPSVEEDRGVTRTGGTWAAKYGKSIADWDKAPPPQYFTELFRVSKHCIIWGGNYFDLPPSRNFIVWRKLSISENFTMAMAELAWTNIRGNAKVFDWVPQGKKDDPRFHPTQKPIELYQWLLSKYAKQGDRILDTHVGSGSSRIACWEMGFDFVGCEIDRYYWEKQEERFREWQTQPKLF